MADFADHFSVQAGTYAEFRPVYPRALFVWLSSLCARHDFCWDVATGNGQAAEMLAEFFASVYASDASEKQIAQAAAHPKIRYTVEAAEKTQLQSQSCDLVTVAQAIHWFRHDAFYAEAKRVLRPGGVLAVWGYGLHSVEPRIDAIVQKYYSEIVGPYWPPERAYIESRLATLPFPFDEIHPPDLAISDHYTLDQMIGYLSSWSSTQRYVKEHGKNPLRLIEDDLKKAWGDAGARSIRWPLYIKATRV